MNAIAISPEVSVIPVEQIARKKNEWVTTEQLRVLLKNNLDLNARKVSVSRRSSNRYLSITIRDASVDIKAVEDFAAKFNTWTMDNTDYVEGQSIDVSTTREVDAAHAAPFVVEILAKIATAKSNLGQTLANGSMLWLDEQGFYISSGVKHASSGFKRMSYIYESDARAGTDWAIHRLALQASRIG